MYHHHRHRTAVLHFLVLPGRGTKNRSTRFIRTFLVSCCVAYTFILQTFIIIIIHYTVTSTAAAAAAADERVRRFLVCAGCWCLAVADCCCFFFFFFLPPFPNAASNWGMCARTGPHTGQRVVALHCCQCHSARRLWAHNRDVQLPLVHCVACDHKAWARLQSLNPQPPRQCLP